MGACAREDTDLGPSSMPWNNKVTAGLFLSARHFWAHPVPEISDPDARSWRSVVEPTLLSGRCILVVEDEPLISLDITRQLQDAGARVFVASHLDKALGLAENPDLAAGVLDFDLGKTDSSPVCRRLFERSIPFVFHSGRMYSAFRQWPRAPVVLKPASQSLIGAVAGLFRSAGK